MAGIRVHEIARQLGRQNREVMELLQKHGITVKSHMTMVDESHITMLKEKFEKMGKEHIANVDTSKEEKMVNMKPEAEKAEAPKKEKKYYSCISRSECKRRRKEQNKKAGG